MTQTLRESFAEVQASYGPGGQREGFRHASISEIRLFFAHAGLTEIVSDESVAADFVNKVGSTITRPLRRGDQVLPVNIGVVGRSGDATVDSTRAGAAALIYSDLGEAILSIHNAFGIGPETLSEDASEVIGDWLVRPVLGDSNFDGVFD